MVQSVSPSTIKAPKPGIKQPSQETALTPRFYTTDFETAANLDLSTQESELQALLTEMRADYIVIILLEMKNLNSRGNILTEKQDELLLNIWNVLVFLSFRDFYSLRNYHGR